MWVTAETGFLIDYLFSLEYLHKIPFIDYYPYLEMAVFELLKFIYHFCKSSKDESQNYENMELYWFVHCMREYWYDFRMCIDIAFEDIRVRWLNFNINVPILNWVKIFKRCMPLKIKKKGWFFLVFFSQWEGCCSFEWPWVFMFRTICHRALYLFLFAL